MIANDSLVHADRQPFEQRLYALTLEWATRVGLVLLLASFSAYAFGWIEPLVPLEQLPSMWRLPTAEFVVKSQVPVGWGWTGRLDRSDELGIGAIAFVAGLSLLPLAAAAAVYLRRRDRLFAALCVAEMAVISLAASGLAQFGH